MSLEEEKVTERDGETDREKQKRVRSDSGKKPDKGSSCVRAAFSTLQQNGAGRKLL